MTVEIEESPLYKVLSSPNDDVVRLVYADWLDENAGTTTCQKCYIDIVVMEFDQKSGTYLPIEDALAYFPDESDECVICMGAGTVSDDRAKRAEFIRVQCRIHEIEQGEKFNNVRRSDGTIAARSEWTGRLIKIDLEEWDKLKQRESSLLWKYHTAWFTPPENMQSDFNIRMIPEVANEPSYVIRRGFIERVQMTLEQFMGRPCDGCGGTGEVDDEIRYGPSFCCSQCNGIRRIGGCATELFSRHPITSVRLIDVNPINLGSSGRWVIFMGSRNRRLPDAIWKKLYKGQVPIAFDSQELAITSLSHELVDYGRSLVGHHYAHELCPTNYGKGFHKTPQGITLPYWECEMCKGTEIVNVKRQGLPMLKTAV